MAKAQWANTEYPSYKQRSKGSKMPMLALAGLAAAAWANRDKIMAAIEKLKDTGASAATAGAAGRTGTGAHRADGSDDSASFAAGIADEGIIPNATGTGGGTSGASF